MTLDYERLEASSTEMLTDRLSTIGRQAWDQTKAALRPNFYRLHLSYFVSAILVSSAILFGANTSGFHLRYINALFLCASAMCNVGLNTVNLGDLNGFQQSVLFVNMLMGDLSLVSISVVVVRRHYFKKYMKSFVEHSATGRNVAKDVEQHGSATARSERGGTTRNRGRQAGINTYCTATESIESSVNRKNELQHLAGHGGFPAPWHGSHWNKALKPLTSRFAGQSPPQHDYLSFEPELDHRGRMHKLTRKQQDEVGRVEYRALRLLTWLLPCYTLFWLALLWVVLTPYVVHTNAGGVIQSAQPGDLDPAWWSIFVSVSAYSNCGLNLLNENMIPLNNNYLILIFTGMMILTGNTLYPVFLRATVWSLSKVVTISTEIHHSLMFLLHHPRRCYLFLFPRRHTIILLLVQVGINLLAWFLFMLLNINYSPVEVSLSVGIRWFDGLFQAHGLRSSGFYIILISDVAPALQFFYLCAMYISAIPIIMSIRTSNIYEERSIGQDDENKSQSALDDPEKQKQASSNMGQHLRRQLAYDLWWILLSVWLISIIERSKLAPSPPPSTISAQPTSLPNPDPGFSLFSILFETVSAYGTVGLSLGVPDNNYSFCGAWQSLSKLILITVMLRGRHRILPMAIDRAILLPGQDIMEELDKKHKAADTSEREVAADVGEIREEERGVDYEAESDESDADEGGQEEGSKAHDEQQEQQMQRRKLKHTDAAGL